LFVRAVLASFISKIKEFGMETSDALLSIKIFFLWRTLTLFCLAIVDLFEWAL
jgi:hypothetical protein